MLEAVPAVKGEPFHLVDRKTLIGLADYILPIGMALLFLASLLLVVQRGTVLQTWSEDYQGSGQFLVESCVESPQFGADQWSCRGRFTAETGTGFERSRMLTSMGAYTSHRPYVGERLDVFFPTGNSSTVYPLAYKLNELSRLYLSLLPRILFLFGSLIWLAGWFLTRKVDVDDFVTRDSIRFPQRFSWRSKGMTWLLAGVVAIGANYWLTTRFLGSLDIL